MSLRAQRSNLQGSEEIASGTSCPRNDAGWRIILDPPGEPQQNMARDAELVREIHLGSAPPTLRIYGWSRPAISLGRRQNPDDLPPEVLRMGLPMVRRPTGGAAVIHRLDELTYAIAVPRPPGTAPLSRMPALFHQSLRDELVRRGFVPAGELRVLCARREEPFALCFNAPTCGDLLHQGRKVAGSALRAWKEGVLIQGSIQGFPVPRSDLEEVLKEAAAVSKAFD
jgi:lipoate-protein ligase A